MNYIIPNDNELYENYIARILEIRPNKKDKNNYQERHHIIPKCKNGNDEDNNLIYLYPIEHYYAHKLLALENSKDIQLARAWWLMSHMQTNQNIWEYVTPEQYNEARKHFGEMLSEKQKGQPMPESCKEAHQKILDEQKIRIRCVETGQEFSSYTEAVHSFGVEKSGNIRLAALGYRKTAYGYHWEIIDNYELQQKAQQNREVVNKELQYKPIYCYELDKVFMSCREACIELHLEPKNLSSVLHGKRKHVNGYSFDFIHPSVEEQEKIKATKEKKKEGKTRKSRSKILCVETNEIYNSQTEAAEATGIASQRISDVVNGYSKTAGGYHWIKVK